MLRQAQHRFSRIYLRWAPLRFGSCFDGYRLAAEIGRFCAPEWQKNSNWNSSKGRRRQAHFFSLSYLLRDTSTMLSTGQKVTKNQGLKKIGLVRKINRFHTVSFLTRSGYGFGRKKWASLTGSQGCYILPLLLHRCTIILWALPGLVGCISSLFIC